MAEFLYFFSPGCGEGQSDRKWIAIIKYSSSTIILEGGVFIFYFIDKINYVNSQSLDVGLNF